MVFNHKEAQGHAEKRKGYLVFFNHREHKEHKSEAQAEELCQKGEARMKATMFAKVLWAWKALPVETLRKRVADTLWAIWFGDEAEADAVMD